MARYGLILYFMARVAAPIDFPTLTELTVCDDGIGYFEFAEAVSELVESGHLTLEDGLYSITEKGRENGAACESSLPYSVKRNCSAQLVKLNGILRRNAQVRAETEPRPEGGYSARMFLDDDGGNLFTLELFCGSQEQANRLAESFKAEPERIYNEVLSALLEHEEKDCIGIRPPPVGAALFCHSSGASTRRMERKRRRIQEWPRHCSSVTGWLRNCVLMKSRLMSSTVGSW